jgi:kinesin family protein 6/9
VRELQRKLQDIKKEKEQDLQDRKGMIAHIKDQLQEAKARTNMNESNTQ